MSAERSFEAWEEMQRHGQDIADRLAQGFNGLLHHSHMSPPSFSWTAPPLKPNKPFDFDLSIPIPSSKWDGLGLGDNPGGINGVSAILDIGSRLGQAGAEFGASLNGVVQQFFRRIPLPFRQDETETLRVAEAGSPSREEGFGSVAEHFRDYGFLDSGGGSDELRDFDEEFGTDLKSSGYFGRSQGSINISSTYDSRTHDIESSLVARGDLWRAEASHGGSNSANENSPLFLIQLGPVLFVRDTTLLLPVHLSKQHLLWYGFDRKNGMHSLCPAMWSKHRRWLLMSMICLNPLACSFMDLQFPNGQLTYVAGEGLTTSAFLPVFGGLLQAQGHYPGETRFSFSCKNKWGTRITPTVQWPDKSVSLGVVQELAWKRCGLMLRPTIQFSICPTFGGNNPGCRAELIHSIKENLSLISGFTCTSHPSAHASISFGRSKWNGNVGSSGIVVRVETPLNNIGRSSFSIQINNGIEF